MIRTILFAALSVSLVACGPVTVTRVPPDAPSARPAPVPQATVSRRANPQTLADFRAVVQRVEPVAERSCRELRPRLNCDFRVVVDDRPGLPPNAFQTYDRQGRPVIGFTASLFDEMQNRDELAFAFAHEAAHHIEGHISQIQATGQTGAALGGILGSLFGLDRAGIEAAQNIGGTVGARRYSKEFELEADSLGARIALRAGYDPLVGVQFFQRAPDPGNQFLGTHPPNAERVAVVRRTVAAN